MCTVYCVELHWAGGRTLRHILAFVIKDGGTRHGYVGFSIFLVMYLPRSGFMDLMAVLVDLVLRIMAGL